ncbi:hypothetical protein AB6A40_007004 [Gnathostoma spinigerum]|uniref:Uncharacterized protein n=1 Tax=Gnathostoma spinigerum TaxID=75299 RepID=A0ABD6EVL5_9BILA
MRRIHSSPSLNHSTNYQFEVSWDERVPDAVKGSHLSPRPLFYRGRCSLNRTSKDASSAVYDHESRQRHSSGRSRRHPRDSSEYVQEDWCPYDCLEIEQNSSSIPDYISTQRVTGSGVLPKDLSISADDPDQFFRCLRCFIIRNTSTQSSRFNEQSSLASVCKHSRKILLVGKKNKKQKFSGVLWLNLQSVVAGR